MNKPAACLIFMCTLLLRAIMANGQGMSVNASGAVADSSAMLDVSSTSKGLLPPRMTTAQKDAIYKPANGLVVFQTDSASGLYCNTGSALAPAWQLLGPAASLAYGYFYNIYPQEIPPPLYNYVTLINVSVENNLFLNPITDAVTVGAAGVYRVAFGLQLGNDILTSTATTSLFVNGSAIAPSFSTSLSGDDANVPLSGEWMLALPAGASLQLECETSEEDVLVLQPYLSITQIQ